MSEVLRIGLPLVAPDQGAFPERLSDRPLTWIRPWDQAAPEWVDFFTALQGDLKAAKGEPSPQAWADQPVAREHPDFYR